MSFSAMLNLAKQGDFDALRTIVEVYGGDLRSYVHKQINAKYRAVFSADDVLQETLHEAYRDISTFNGLDEDSFHAWIRRVARNRIVDEIRRETRLKRGGQADPERWIDVGEQVTCDRRISQALPPSPSQIVAQKEAAEAVRQAISQLKQPERVAINMFYICGFETDEIAEAMNRTPHAVRALLQRAREHLRSELGQSSDWLSRYQ